MSGAREGGRDSQGGMDGGRKGVEKEGRLREGEGQRERERKKVGRVEGSE